VRRRVERLEADLEEARRELERLKAVDLRPRPGAPLGEGLGGAALRAPGRRRPEPRVAQPAADADAAVRPAIGEWRKSSKLSKHAEEARRQGAEFTPVVIDTFLSIGTNYSV